MFTYIFTTISRATLHICDLLCFHLLLILYGRVSLFRNLRLLSAIEAALVAFCTCVFGHLLSGFFVNNIIQIDCVNELLELF